jgi:hypothetical protein
MANKKYRLKNVRGSDCFNNYYLLDNAGKVIRKHEGAACFSAIYNNPIPEHASTILISHPKARVPFSEDLIERWIDDLNDMGFPCAFVGSSNDDQKYNFQVNLDDYPNKAHFLSTLILIRNLYEDNICNTIEHYFEMIDSNPNMDKLEALQMAHKQESPYRMNSGHMITSQLNGDKNVSQEKLFEKFKNSNHRVRGGESRYGYISITNHWKATPCFAK